MKKFQKITVELDGDETAALQDAINILYALTDEGIEDANWVFGVCKSLEEIVSQESHLVCDEEVG